MNKEKAREIAKKIYEETIFIKEMAMVKDELFYVYAAMNTLAKEAGYCVSGDELRLVAEELRELAKGAKDE